VCEVPGKAGRNLRRHSFIAAVYGPQPRDQARLGGDIELRPPRKPRKEEIDTKAC
jgi:hypothetical protein